ncbi:MAG: hypothetical protein WC642_15710, partial [Nocardioides sp.]
PGDHLATLIEHAPDLKPHVVLADRCCVGDDVDHLAATVESYGARLVLDDLKVEDGSPRHDPAKLAAAYARIFAEG